MHRLENRTGPDQQLDAGGQLRARGDLELGQDDVGGGLPYGCTGLGQHGPIGRALGHTHKHVSVTDPKLSETWAPALLRLACSADD